MPVLICMLYLVSIIVMLCCPSWQRVNELYDCLCLRRVWATNKHGLSVYYYYYYYVAALGLLFSDDNAMSCTARSVDDVVLQCWHVPPRPGNSSD